MTAASIYSCRTAWRMTAASSIQGTGAQNLASAIRQCRSFVSGIALGPYFASRALTSSLVRPGARLSLSPGCPVSVGEAKSAVTAIIIQGYGDRVSENEHSCSERWRCSSQGRITEDSDGAEDGATDERGEDKHRVSASSSVPAAIRTNLPVSTLGRPAFGRIAHYSSLDGPVGETWILSDR